MALIYPFATHTLQFIILQSITDLIPIDTSSNLALLIGAVVAIVVILGIVVALQRALGSTLLGIVGLLLMVALLVFVLLPNIRNGGSIGSLFGSSQPALFLPMADITPAEWRSLGNLVDVNIDGDAEVERLFFYNYDNDPNDATATGNGPIGATIYDIQIDADWVTGVTETVPIDYYPDPYHREYYPIPNQPSSFFTPFRIVPSYWEPAIGRSRLTSAKPRQSVPHYIAPPIVNFRNIVVQQVSPVFGDSGADSEQPTEDEDAAVADTAANESSVTTSSAAAAGDPPQELIIRGGETHITIVWWKNDFDGYGVTQLHGPYGFINEVDQGQILGASPIRAITGQFPENDRSRLCRRVLYQRNTVPDVTAHDPSPNAITYDTSELGLHFCDETPIHPFYPEGVVLAYLREPAAHGNLLWLDERLNTPELLTMFESVARLNDGERVENIYTRVGIPQLNHQETLQEDNLGRVQGGPTYAWQTNVCVDIVQSAGQSGQQRDVSTRQLRLRMQHRPPELSGMEQTDRWYISGVVPPPQRGTGQINYAYDDGFSCQQFIEARRPEG